MTGFYFWGLEIQGNYKILNEDGYASIHKDFEKETEEYLLDVKQDMEERER